MLDAFTGDKSNQVSDLILVVRENPTSIGLAIELNKTDQLFSFGYSMNAEKANHQSQNLCTEA